MNQIFVGMVCLNLMIAKTATFKRKNYQDSNNPDSYRYRVNSRISDRAEIRTPNFQLQYLLQLELYSKNLTIMLEPFTGTL